MEDWEIRAALDAHWAASDANDFELEHQIYREDAVLEYPQSAERIRGRRNIQASRFAQPSMKRFTVRRILGAADLWVTEFVLTYDGQPSYTVSIMEFKDGKVARETQYFGDAFEPGPSRAQWVELMRLNGNGARWRSNAASCRARSQNGGVQGWQRPTLFAMQRSPSPTDLVQFLPSGLVR
jgi:hypothetical protein